MYINKFFEKYNLEVNDNQEVQLNDFFTKILKPKKLSDVLARATKSSAKYQIRINNNIHYISIDYSIW